MSHFGVLNIDKPPGCTSRDVVNRAQRLVKPAKVGHAGTLDPLASGVLVICVGKATRLIEYVQRMPKQYRATFLLGHYSDSDDAEGDVDVVEDAPVPDRERLEAVLPRFLGEIQQTPPAYSAVKIAGRRAYQLARQGSAPELPARPVVIHRLHLEHYDYPRLNLAIECGSGTYVRALGRDIAAALGTTAVMSALRRTAIGEFRIEDSLPLDELSSDSLRQGLQSPLTALSGLARVNLSDEQLHEVRHGRPIRIAFSGRAIAMPEWAAVDPDGRLIAILREKHSGEWWPDKTFFQPDDTPA